MKIYEGPDPKKWVLKLIGRHIGRLKLDDAPEQGTEQYLDAALIWDEAFQRINATASEADKASRRVASSPTPWWREQLPAVIAAIDAERGSNFAQGPDAPTMNGREAAAAESKGCTHCDGSGLAPVWHRLYDGSPILTITYAGGDRRRVAGTAALACTCALGRWMLDRNRTADGPTAMRLDGYEAVREGRSRYVAYDPTSRSSANEPIRREPLAAC